MIHHLRSVLVPICLIICHSLAAGLYNPSFPPPALVAQGSAFRYVNSSKIAAYDDHHCLVYGSASFSDTNWLAGVAATVPFRFSFATELPDPAFQPPPLAGVWALAVQADGGILLNEVTENYSRILRLHPDGSRDPGFVSPLLTHGTRQIVEQSDGKILLAMEGFIVSEPSALAIPTQPNEIIRLLPQGGMDPDFHRAQLDGICFAPPVVDSAGRIYLGGAFRTVDGTSRRGLARLTPDGNLDATFAGFSSAPNTLSSATIRAVLEQSDGKIVVVGSYAFSNSPSLRYMAARFANTGQWDATFTTLSSTGLFGAPSFSFPRAARLDGDKIVYCTTRLGRLLANGEIDPTFQITEFQGEEVFSFAQGPDGNWLVSLSNLREDYLVQRIGRDGGSLGFLGAGIHGFRVRAPQLHAWDGKLLLSGKFNSLDGVAASDGMAWVDANGRVQPMPSSPGLFLDPQLAPTFQVNTRFLASVGSMAWWAVSAFDGYFTFQSIPEQLLRLGPDGQWQKDWPVDAAWTADPLYVGQVFPLRNGQALVVRDTYDAALAEVAGTPVLGVIRVDSQGSSDASFPGLESSLNSEQYLVDTNTLQIRLGMFRFLQELPDGRLVFARINRQGIATIGLMTAQGQVLQEQPLQKTGGFTAIAVFTTPIDPWGQFELSRYQSPVLSSCLLANGDLAIAGNFETVGELDSPHLAIFDTAGFTLKILPDLASPENSLSDPLIPLIQSLAEGPDGHLYAAGRFSHWKGERVDGLVKFTSDYVRDTDFSPSLGLLPALLDRDSTVSMVRQGPFLFLAGPLQTSDGAEPPLAKLDFTATVAIRDPALETALLQALGKPAGTITEADLTGLQTLDLTGKNLTDITELALAEYLVELHLTDNRLSDLSPIAQLPLLQRLFVQRNLLDVEPGSDDRAVIDSLTARGVGVAYQPQLGLTARGSGRSDFEQSTLPPELEETSLSDLVAGEAHNIYITLEGTVGGWGNNEYGQLNVPVDLQPVEGLVRPRAAKALVKSIAAGYFHSLAVTSDGAARAWGRNDTGQCDVPTGLTGVVALTGGLAHTLALTSDGRVAAWGDNTLGQTQVPETGFVRAIAAGKNHNLALVEEGRIVAWGDNSVGQSAIPEFDNPVLAIAAGEEHSLVLLRDGTVAGWGSNQFGQLDIPEEIRHSAPLPAVRPRAAKAVVVSIAAGFFHNIAVTQDGRVLTWGSSDFGQLEVPARVTEGLRKVVAGGGHTLYLYTNRLVGAYLWGDALDIGNGLRLSRWYNFFFDGYYPWIFHFDHGWQYCTGDAESTAFYYDAGMNSWMYTNSYYYPFLFRFSSGSWLWFIPGSKPWPNREFYDFGTSTVWYEATNRP